MLHITITPHSTLSTAPRPEMFLGASDKQHNKVIRCMACNAPVVDSAYSIRRHILNSKPKVTRKASNGVVVIAEQSKGDCEAAFQRLGYNSNGIQMDK